MITTQFIVGEKVVYPNHGVGIIEQISSRTIGTSVERFYLLRIRSSSLKVMVPFHNAETVGLRRIVKNRKRRRFWSTWPTASARAAPTGRTGLRKIPTRCAPARLMEVAIVLKGLLILAAQKPLSFREKKMLERARFLLISEMAMARGREEEEVEEELRKALIKCKLRWPEAASIEA